MLGIRGFDFSKPFLFHNEVLITFIKTIWILFLIG